MYCRWTCIHVIWLTAFFWWSYSCLFSQIVARALTWFAVRWILTIASDGHALLMGRLDQWDRVYSPWYRFHPSLSLYCCMEWSDSVENSKCAAVGNREERVSVCCVSSPLYVWTHTYTHTHTHTHTHRVVAASYDSVETTSLTVESVDMNRVKPEASIALRVTIGDFRGNGCVPVPGLQCHYQLEVKLNLGEDLQRFTVKLLFHIMKNVCGSR